VVLPAQGEEDEDEDEVEEEAEGERPPPQADPALEGSLHHHADDPQEDKEVPWAYDLPQGRQGDDVPQEGEAGFFVQKRVDRVPFGPEEVRELPDARPVEGGGAHGHVPPVGEDHQGVEKEAEEDEVQAFQVAVLVEAVPHQEEDQELGQGAGPLGLEHPPVGAVGQAPFGQGGQEKGPGRLELYAPEVFEPGSEGEGEAESKKSCGEVERDTDPPFASR